MILILIIILVIFGAIASSLLKIGEKAKTTKVTGEDRGSFLSIILVIVFGLLLMGDLVYVLFLITRHTPSVPTIEQLIEGIISLPVLAYIFRSIWRMEKSGFWSLCFYCIVIELLPPRSSDYDSGFLFIAVVIIPVGLAVRRKWRLFK